MKNLINLKSLIRFSRIAFFVSLALFACLLTYAQAAVDSATVAEANQLVAFISGKWPIMATIFGVVAVVSEILAVIPSKYLPANGVLDLIVKAVKSITWKKKDA